jgi:putative hemolysin
VEPQIIADTHVLGGESAMNMNDHESREYGVCDSPGGGAPRVPASTETRTEHITRIDEWASKPLANEPTEITPSQDEKIL